MTTSDVLILLVILLVPAPVVLMIALLRGYQIHIHFRKDHH